METERLSFGLVPPASFVGVDKHLNALLRWLEARTGVRMVRRQVASYDDLARLLRVGVLHVAWLPPILYARLDVEGVVQDLVSAERGGSEPFVSVLVARAGSRVASIDDLQGVRAGWVDPLSATGYVVPRLRLAARGKNPSKLFRSEAFFGSHGALIRAVLDGIVDVGATYAGCGSKGELLRGAFTEVGAQSDDLQVVAAFGSLPSDVIAARLSLPEDIRARLAEAFAATADDPAMLDAVRTTFGAMRLVRKPLTGYDELRAELATGVVSEVIPASTAFLSTRPPL